MSICRDAVRFNLFPALSVFYLLTGLAYEEGGFGFDLVVKQTPSFELAFGGGEVGAWARKHPLPRHIGKRTKKSCYCMGLGRWTSCLRECILPRGRSVLAAVAGLWTHNHEIFMANEARKKELKQQVRNAERQRLIDSLPVDIETLKDLLTDLNENKDQRCDHTLTKTTGFLNTRGIDPKSMIPWLQGHGGYCDCEVLANVDDVVGDIIGPHLR